jgi:hypothetical protein
MTTLFFRSTKNQRGNSSPIFAIVSLYCIFQCAVFFFCPFTHMGGRPIALGAQAIIPSTHTLFFRSTRNLCGNFLPVLAIVLLYCILGGPSNMLYDVPYIV